MSVQADHVSSESDTHFVISPLSDIH